MLLLGMNFESQMPIPKYLHADLLWWEKTILTSSNVIKYDAFKIEIFTDASLTGWGGCSASEKTHGFWNDSNKHLHINVLELKAIFYGIKCFASHLHSCSVLLRCDNTTAISYVNRHSIP